MLNEMAHQNASKFAIFEMYKNTKVFFTFIALGEKVKYHEMKKQPWDMENFEVQISLLYSFDSFGKLPKQKIFLADTETNTEMVGRTKISAENRNSFGRTLIFSQVWTFKIYKCF